MKKIAATILVLNMHAGWDTARESNLGRVAALVRATKADVVLLQEVDRGTRRSKGVDQPAVLRRLTGLAPAFGRTLDYDGGEYGIAILVRGRVDASEVIGLSVDPPQERAGGSTEPRGVLTATVVLRSGLKLRVLNTHLDASRDERYRLQEADRLTAAIRALPGDAPLMLGGDFNATPESETYARLAKAGLADAWAGCGAGDGLTYPADAPVKRIDYLFLTPALACEEARVLRFDGSDHRAVLVQVRISPR